MKLYLDENVSSTLLARMLAKAGHDVQTAYDARMLGKDDPNQLAHAVQNHRVILTLNYEAFLSHHRLVQVVGGRHFGILVARQDDRNRKMAPNQIVQALKKLEAAVCPSPTSTSF